MSKKKEESIAKYPRVNDDELLDFLDGLKKEIKPTPNIETINVEELHKVINKVAKDIYEKEWKK